ncbi:MAG: hypothetical protein H0W86_07070 [Armatimonadetes bacterium]|nr:hypothetical protein [Armatimonadota bacterium]
MLPVLVSWISIMVVGSGSDYFPLRAGLTWEYVVSVQGSALRIRQVQKALELVLVSGTNATPMEVWIDGKLDSTSYYRPHAGYISLVAISEKQSLPLPIPVIPAAPKKGLKWEFDGQTMMFGMMVQTKTKYRIVDEVDMDVLGQKRMCIKVESETKMGAGKTAMDIKATEIYAEGVGLFYRFQRVTSERGGSATTTLVKFEGKAD